MTGKKLLPSVVGAADSVAESTESVGVTDPWRTTAESVLGGTTAKTTNGVSSCSY